MKLCDWGNLDRRLHVWEIVKINDGEKELNKKASKLYEVLTILSALSCGALIGLEEANSSHIEYLIDFYEATRTFGIISSLFSIVVSVTMCSLLSATSTKNTIYIKYLLGFLIFLSLRLLFPDLSRSLRINASMARVCYDWIFPIFFIRYWL